MIYKHNDSILYSRIDHNFIQTVCQDTKAIFIEFTLPLVDQPIDGGEWDFTSLKPTQWSYSPRI